MTLTCNPCGDVFTVQVAGVCEPVPETVTVCGEPGALFVRLTVSLSSEDAPVILPYVGVKSMDNVQMPAAASGVEAEQSV